VSIWPTSFLVQKFSVNFSVFLSGLLQIEYRKELENNSRIASIKTVSAASSSMLLSKIDVNDNATFYNVSVPLTLLKMENYRKLLGAVNASFHRKYCV
jgi:hypothetical protein